jgi:hypothetical protein
MSRFVVRCPPGLPFTILVCLRCFFSRFPVCNQSKRKMDDLGLFVEE